jgi:hypothetical protein
VLGRQGRWAPEPKSYAVAVSLLAAGASTRVLARSLLPLFGLIGDESEVMVGDERRLPVGSCCSGPEAAALQMKQALRESLLVERGQNVLVSLDMPGRPGPRPRRHRGLLGDTFRCFEGRGPLRLAARHRGRRQQGPGCGRAATALAGRPGPASHHLLARHLAACTCAGPTWGPGLVAVLQPRSSPGTRTRPAAA